MKLWIVVNHFLRNKKFIEIEEKFKIAASELSVEYEIKTNMECMCMYTPYSYDDFNVGIPDDNNPVLFWDKDLILAETLEKRGHRVYNSSKAIGICDSKCLTALALSQKNINMPETIIAPMTYDNIGLSDLSYLKKVEETLGYPLVIKEAYGSFGAQVYLINDYDELIKRVKSVSGKHLYQKYIKSSHGRDLRLQVVGDRVSASMFRYSENDFRANITNGGRMKPHKPTIEQCEIAVEVTKALGLDFAGVDLLFGEHDEPVVCEVNSNAHFKNLDDCTGSDIAKDIITYIIAQENDGK